MRREVAANAITRESSVQQYLQEGALTFTLAPDNSRLGPYDEAAKDCSFIIHAGSLLPTMSGDPISETLIGTKAILEAAEATPSVKRVVFTGSVYCFRPFERMFRDRPANQAIAVGEDEEVLTASTPHHYKNT